MPRQLIPRGALAGALAGLLAFLFARVFAEPQIAAAVDYETGRDAAQAAVDSAAGAAVDSAAGAAVDSAPAEVFGRGVQATVGLGLGTVLMGVAMGVLVAVVFTVCLGRVGSMRPRLLALLVAGGGFLGIFLVPFLKYPANPPAIGHPETIGERSVLYLSMVFASVVLLGLAAVLGRRFAPRRGPWSATLAAAGVFVVAIGVVMVVLPSVGELASNRQRFGALRTETPLPVRAADGTIVYPGFPADVLAAFRLYAVGAQLILWAATGGVFAVLADRVLSPAAAPGVRAPV